MIMNKYIYLYKHTYLDILRLVNVSLSFLKLNFQTNRFFEDISSEAGYLIIYSLVLLQGKYISNIFLVNNIIYYFRFFLRSMMDVWSCQAFHETDIKINVFFFKDVLSDFFLLFPSGFPLCTEQSGHQTLSRLNGY